MKRTRRDVWVLHSWRVEGRKHRPPGSRLQAEAQDLVVHVSWKRAEGAIRLGFCRIRYPRQTLKGHIINPQAKRFPDPISFRLPAG